MKLFLVATVIMTVILPVNASAADDDFSGPYFTAQAPEALAGEGSAAIALSEPDAAAVAGIEPAAGESVTPPHNQVSDKNEPNK